MRPWQFATRQLLLYLVIAALCALVGRVIHQRILHGKRSAVASRLNWIVQMIKEADAIDGALPKPVRRDGTGAPLSSWRFQILSHVGLDCNCPPDWRKPWNTKRNLRFAEEATSLFCFAEEKTPVNRRQETNVMAIVGADTAFDVTRQVRFHALPEHMIILCEVCDSGIHWMQPGDLSLDMLQKANRTAVPRLGGTVAGGFLVAFSDGEVWLLAHRTPREVLTKMGTISGAAQADREDVLGQYCLEQYIFD
jgi:hypothetical protein